MADPGAGGVEVGGLGFDEIPAVGLDPLKGLVDEADLLLALLDEAVKYRVGRHG